MWRLTNRGSCLRRIWPYIMDVCVCEGGATLPTAVEGASCWDMLGHVINALLVSLNIFVLCVCVLSELEVNGGDRPVVARGRGDKDLEKKEFIGSRSTNIGGSNAKVDFRVSENTKGFLPLRWSYRDWSRFCFFCFCLCFCLFLFENLVVSVYGREDELRN